MDESKPYSRDDRDDEATKLKRARERFQHAIEHHATAHAEARRCARFYHNSNMEGQWEPDDLEALRDQGRPAFSFNVIRGKIDNFLGMYADSQRKPKVSGSGDEDQLLAEVLDIVAQKMLDDAKYQRHAARQIKTGTIEGECALRVGVVPSHEGRGWIKLDLDRIVPAEIHWDPSSIEPDRSDARYVFWSRWLSESDFAEEYPEHASEFRAASQRDTFQQELSETDMHGESLFEESDPDYGESVRHRYYYDRHKDKIRVIWYEYETYQDVYYATNAETGERIQQIAAEDVARIEDARDMLGVPMTIEKTREPAVHVCQFVGSKILKDWDSAGPFDGKSIKTYCHAIDEADGTAYSFVRNLIDPQMELNKSMSQQIEHNAQRITTGAIAETGAVVDEYQFRDALRQPNGLAMVKKGALTEGKIQLRNSQPADPSASARLNMAVDLLNEISGISSSAALSPAEQAQAGMTVAIRYHKALQAVQDSFGNFEDAQRDVYRSVIQAITRAMPDDQIQSILADDGRFRVGNGVVVEMIDDPNGSGQMVPMRRAELRNVRQLKWNIELEHTSSNNTLRMVQFDALLSLANAGIPVPPDLAVEMALESRSAQERAKKYIHEQEAAGAEQAETEAQTFIAQQMAALQETARHNRAEESIKAEKVTADVLTEILTIWERGDEAEKAFAIEQLRMMTQPRQLGA